MNVSPINNNNASFGASYRVYFCTTDGRRIVSDENMRKCLHYLEAHLNGSKRVKVHNQELIDTFKYGQVLQDGRRAGGDADYRVLPKIRSVIDKTKGKVQGFINIVTGEDVNYVNEEYGKFIGIAKGVSKKRLGTTKSFETGYAVGRYVDRAPDYAEKKAVFTKDGERVFFGAYFDPIYKKNGDLKGFEYKGSGFYLIPKEK